MKVSSKRLLFIQSFLLLLLMIASQTALAERPRYTKDWREWVEMPADSIQEEERRIWIANETGQFQRIRIDILDLSNQVIRHFIEADFNPGYVNVYWDKKNDSGLWVEPGRYRYRLTVIGKEKSGSLRASFDPNELLVELYPETKGSPGLIRFDITRDSVLVSAGIYLWGGRSISLLMTDSLHLKGSYQFRWTNSEEMHQAAYSFHLTAAGITHQTKISRVISEKK